MNGIEISVIVVVAALFAAAVGYLIKRKLKNKDGGNCCEDCSHCSFCRRRNGKEKEERQ